MYGAEEAAKHTAELFKGEQKQFNPNLAYKVDKRYKWRYLLYKKIAIVLSVMLLGLAYTTFMVMRGNISLAKQLEQTKTITIMPNGTKTLTSK